MPGYVFGRQPWPVGMVGVCSLDRYDPETVRRLLVPIGGRSWRRTKQWIVPIQQLEEARRRLATLADCRQLAADPTYDPRSDGSRR